MELRSLFDKKRAKLHEPYGRPENGVDVLWRVEALSYSYVIDADREEYGVTAPRLELRWYEVIRRTPRGAWIRCSSLFADTRFVLLTAAKRFACDTIDEALESFRQRRRVQARILAKRLDTARYELGMVEDVIARRLNAA